MTTSLMAQSSIRLSYHSFVGQKSEQPQLGSLLRVSPGWSEGSISLGSYLEALGENLPPDSFRLLVELSSLWLYDWGPHFLAGCWPGIILSFSRIPHIPRLTASSIFRIRKSASSPSVASSLSEFFFCPQAEESSAVKTHVITSGLPW